MTLDSMGLQSVVESPAVALKGVISSVPAVGDMIYPGIYKGVEASSKRSGRVTVQSC